MIFKKSIGNVLILLIATAALVACGATATRPIEDAKSTGVVLLHGKGGTTRWVEPLATNLKAIGVQVITPDMPWHKKKIYGRSFEDSMHVIERYVGRLRASGASRIIVAGHSLGATAAAGYAAQVGSIDGLILLAPGHFTSQSDFKKKLEKDVKKAEALVASGKSEEISSFRDIKAGMIHTRYVTPKVYLSWFSPTGPADFVSNMSNVKENTPVLYVAAGRDKIPQTKNRDYAFSKTPKNPKSKFITINSTHLDLPRLSADVVIEWIRDL